MSTYRQWALGPQPSYRQKPIKQHFARPYSIAHGREDEHAAALRRGLERLGPGFVGHLCGVCKGGGSRRERYTAGCGMGSYWSTGACDWCDGIGLRQHDNPAPLTVLDQVLRAGEADA